ncbi:hypothetical protein QAD02_001789 [Eretmocerus hayati]|uniref:Uncharacterized protein n=1 Tax=Eretmocerus hayati TaxID=131215 RepID=A0ACC2NLV2_9HYME|nr:hypothetical protein QAD02_001789 [Eretmocerus hayati]
MPLAWSLSTPVPLMTPLGGACYSKDCIKELAKDYGTDPANLLKAIAKSTQSEGHYMAGSDANIAIAAAIAAARGIKDEAVKVSVVTKTVKHYIAQNNMPDETKLNICYKYATAICIQKDNSRL